MFVASCFLVSACAGTSTGVDSTDGTPVATAGAEGNEMPSMGGTAGAGAPSVSAGSPAIAGETFGGESGVVEDAGASGLGVVGGSGGATEPGGSAGKSATSTGIDYSIWELQLPTGALDDPDTYLPAQLLKGIGSNLYFYKAKDGGQVFMDPQQGAGTGGSKHCRSEMRETTTGGAAAAWHSTGTNTMTVEGALLKVGGGSKGSVTIGQVFVSPSNTLCELQYSAEKGGLVLFYEESKGNAPPAQDLKTPIAMNQRYKFTLGFSKGVLTVNVNDLPVYSRKPSPEVAAKTFYFKFGNYDQNATKALPPGTAPFTEVEAYAVKVVHQ